MNKNLEQMNYTQDNHVLELDDANYDDNVGHYCICGDRVIVKTQQSEMIDKRGLKVGVIDCYWEHLINENPLGSPE